MKTKFPYEGKIDYNAYLDRYLEREDAVRRLPSEAELLELARKNIVKDQLVLAPVPEGECAQLGDTVTLATASSLPKFNKSRVTVSIGRGLYDRGLEEAVAGRRAGENFSVEVKDTPVQVSVLEIKRKTVPEPTDEMVQALQQKDYHNQLIRTVAEYEAFVREEQTMQALSTVNYYVMEQILKDYPMEEYDQSDIQRLGELEREVLHKIVLEQEGTDLNTLSREEMQERWLCDSFDDFIKMRHDWYQMKIQQCLIYLNILGLPCEGKNDPLDHYEVLSELQMKMFDFIKAELERRNQK